MARPRRWPCPPNPGSPPRGCRQWSQPQRRCWGPAAPIRTRLASPAAKAGSRPRGCSPSPAHQRHLHRVMLHSPRSPLLWGGGSGLRGFPGWPGAPTAGQGPFELFPILHAGCSQFLLPGGFFQAGSGCCSSNTLQHSQGDRTFSLFRPTNSVLHLNNPQPAFLPASEQPEPRGSEPGRGGASASPPHSTKAQLCN